MYLKKFLTINYEIPVDMVTGATRPTTIPMDIHICLVGENSLSFTAEDTQNKREIQAPLLSELCEKMSDYLQRVSQHIVNEQIDNDDDLESRLFRAINGALVNSLESARVQQSVYIELYGRG